MKPIVALSIIATVTMVSAGAVAAAEMKSSQKSMVQANLWGEMPTPHYKTSGKPISAKWGEQVFTDHCALCHGLHGKGEEQGIGHHFVHFQCVAVGVPIVLCRIGFLQEATDPLKLRPSHDVGVFVSQQVAAKESKDGKCKCKCTADRI